MLILPVRGVCHDCVGGVSRKNGAEERYCKEEEQGVNQGPVGVADVTSVAVKRVWERGSVNEIESETSEGSVRKEQPKWTRFPNQMSVNKDEIDCIKPGLPLSSRASSLTTKKHDAFHLCSIVQRTHEISAALSGHVADRREHLVFWWLARAASINTREATWISGLTFRIVQDSAPLSLPRDLRKQPLENTVQCMSSSSYYPMKSWKT